MGKFLDILNLICVIANTIVIGMGKDSPLNWIAVTICSSVVLKAILRNEVAA
jgi:hypothetical protein